MDIKAPSSWENVKQDILNEIEKDATNAIDRPLPIEVLDEIEWADVKEAIDILSAKIKGEYSPTLIVGIEVIGVGGGGVVADMLSRTLNAPMDVISLRRVKNECKYKSYASSVIPSTKRLLLVDDISFSGCTISDAISYVKKIIKPEEIRVATIIYSRTNKKAKNDMEPDFYICVTDKSEFKMPWGITRSSLSTSVDNGTDKISLKKDDSR